MATRARNLWKTVLIQKKQHSKPSLLPLAWMSALRTSRVVVLTHGPCYAAVADAASLPCDLVSRSTGITFERQLPQHGAVPHWACQPGRLAGNVANISPCCVRCSGAETGPFLTFCSFSLPQRTPSVEAFLLTHSHTPASVSQPSSLCYINYSFFLNSFGGNGIWTKMKSGECHNRFPQRRAGGAGHRILCARYSSHVFVFLFLLCCREISHLARADR